MKLIPSSHRRSAICDGALRPADTTSDSRASMPTTRTVTIGGDLIVGRSGAMRASDKALSFDLGAAPSFSLGGATVRRFAATNLTGAHVEFPARGAGGGP
jgi:hypothetical protein